MDEQDRQRQYDWRYDHRGMRVKDDMGGTVCKVYAHCDGKLIAEAPGLLETVRNLASAVLTMTSDSKYVTTKQRHADAEEALSVYNAVMEEING